MANVNDVYAALNRLGFETMGSLCFGTWNGYAVSLRPLTGNIYYTDVAVRLPKIPAGLKRALGRAIKEPGLRVGGMEQVRKNVIVASLSFARTDDPARLFAERMDKLTAALREQGIAPANTCAITGADRPDSLCLVSIDGIQCYQPVCAAAVRNRETQTREKIEDNQINGSYALGIIGALLGMLVGLIPNLLSIILAESIWSLLFALVPLCAMFGYKLFKGKMSRGSIVIVIVLSLLGVVLIPFFEIIIYLVKDYGISLGESLGYAVQIFRDPEFFSKAGSEYLQLLLFMALGIWIAWRYISGQTNSSQALSSETQIATLRPNPTYAQEEETGSVQ